MNPILSIVVPVYEVEPYLEKCILSILAQTFLDYELILLDDESPDQCGKICDEYALRDSRIKVIHKKYGGVSSSRNAGIKMAQGDYIAFVDSDDFIHKHMYEILYNCAIVYSSDLVVCDIQKVIIGNPYPMDTMIDDEIPQHFTNIEALQKLFSSQQEDLLSSHIKWEVVWNKLYKRSLFEELSFIEGKIYEDVCIAHELLYNSFKISFVPQKLYYYVQRPGSIINSPYSIKRFDKVYALNQRSEFMRKINQKELHHKALLRFIDSFFFTYLEAQEVLIHIEDIKRLKRSFDNNLLLMLKNPLIGWKHKLFYLLFSLHPHVLKSYKSIKKLT